jgi:hypothetical protein
LVATNINGGAAPESGHQPEQIKLASCSLAVNQQRDLSLVQDAP